MNIEIINDRYGILSLRHTNYHIKNVTTADTTEYHVFAQEYGSEELKFHSSYKVEECSELWIYYVAYLLMYGHHDHLGDFTVNIMTDSEVLGVAELLLLWDKNKNINHFTWHFDSKKLNKEKTVLTYNVVFQFKDEYEEVDNISKTTRYFASIVKDKDDNEIYCVITRWYRKPSELILSGKITDEIVFKKKYEYGEDYSLINLNKYIKEFLSTYTYIKESDKNA